MKVHRIITKIISIITAAVITVSLFILDFPLRGTFEKVEDTDYSITFYWGPAYEDFTDAEVTRMKEAGFDVATIYNLPWGVEIDGKRRFGPLYECVEKLEKQGLNASVNDGRISGLIDKNRLDITEEEMEGRIKRIAEQWEMQGLTNVTEFYLFDEPSIQMAPVLAKAVKLMRKYFPDCTTYINLLPIYAHPDIMGTDSYEEYVETFARDVAPDYLCTDYYAFVGNTRRETYALNLEILKRYGEQYGMETRFIVLCSQHLVYKSVSRVEIAWQANLSLLYGNKQLSWFTYAHPGDGYFNEMIDVKGNATQHYYDIKDENRINRVLGNALYDTEFDDAFYVGREVLGMSEYEGYGKLGKMKSGQDMYVSFFDNGYVMMMSQYSDGNLKSTFQADSISRMQWCNPETARWEGVASCPYVDGDTVTLTAGQAVLLR